MGWRWFGGDVGFWFLDVGILGGFLFSVGDFVDGPLGVFGNEGVGILGGSLEGGEVVAGSGVSEGNADVAEEAGALGALDGRFAKEAAEFFVGEGQEVAQAVVEDRLAGMQLAFLRNFREAIPWADGEAIVAAVDAVTHERAKLEGDGAFVLDGEVGDAASCIHGVGGGNRLGGAGVNAGGALAAVVVLRTVGGKGKGREEVGQKEPSAESAMNLDGGLAIPAEPGFVGKVTFEDGAGIGVVTLGSAVLFEEFVELAQAGGDDVVVVAVPGVGGNAIVGRGMGAGMIVESHHDDGLAAREHDARVRPALGVALEPSHVSVFAFLNPFLIGVGMGSPNGRGHLEVCEAEFAGLFGEKSFEFGGVDGWEFSAQGGVVHPV